MIYPKLQFPAPHNRPYFYTNFVQTVDGKVQVTADPKSYWPIGSKVDYQTLLELRAHADVLIHGKRTTTWTRTLDSLGGKPFQKRRKELGKTSDLLYAVVSAHPEDTLIPYLDAPPDGVTATLLTTDTAIVSPKLADTVPTVRTGKEQVDIDAISRYFHLQKYKLVLVEGGPTLLGAFLANDMIDELFITIAPKIIGSLPGQTLSLVENQLFPPAKVKNLKLISAIPYSDELYLRYQMVRKEAK